MASMVILYAGVAFGLSRLLDPEELAAWLEPRLERALSRDVDVARVEVGFFPLAVGLREVTLSDPTGLAPSLARVTSVDLRVEVLPLLRREVKVHRLTVDGLVADLRISGDGKSNFGDLSTRGGDEAGGPDDTGETSGMQESDRPFTLDLKGVRLTSGAVRFGRDSDTLLAELGDLRLRATLRREADGSWLLVGSSNSELNLRRGGSNPLFENTPVGLSFDVRADGKFDLLQIRTGELRLDRIALDLTGDLEGLQDPIRSVSLALVGQGLPLADILAALPGSTRNDLPLEAAGLLAVDLRIEGEVGPGHLPEISGEVDLTQGRLTLDGKSLAEDLSADLSLMRGSSAQARAQASVLDGPLSVDGTIALGEGGNFDLTVRANPDLERLESIIELRDGMTLTGRLNIQTRVTGPLKDMEGLRFNGELRPALVRISLPSLAVPIEIPGGSFQISGIRGTVEDLPVSLGDDRLSISGEIGDILTILDRETTPRFEGSLRGSRLDLRKISAKAPPDSTLSYGKVAFAKLGGRPVGALRIEEAARELGLARPDSLPFTGGLDLRLDTVIDRRGRMENLSARVEFGPAFLRISDAVFNRFGGDIRTSANLTLGPELAAPFSMNLEVREVDAAAFLSRTSPLGRFVTGRITLDMDLIGSLDSLLLPDRSALVGSGAFSLSGGLNAVPLTQALANFLGLESLRAPSIQNWGTSFILEDGRVRLAEATLRGVPGTPRVGGTVGLDGGLDLQSAFDLPSERLSASALARLGVAGEIAANVLTRPEVVQAVLRIGGSVLNPTIQADPRAAALALGAAVEQEVRSEVQEQLDAQRAEAERVLGEHRAEAQRRIDEQKQQLQNRATGFLRSLVERRDTVQLPPPPDTTPPGALQVDTLARDTLRPDTIRPDTVRPDTVRPDTVRPDTVRPDTTRPDTVRPDTVRADSTRFPACPPASA